MIHAVVFDLGGVLAHGEGITAEPARLLGVPEAEFAAAYWAGRDAYDAGASDREYWEPLLVALGKPAALETVQQLARLDARLWLRLDPDARALLAEVREAGLTTAVLTNAPVNLDCGLVEADFAREADHWFVSASMGLTKPQRAVFWRVAEVLDLPAGQIAFLDDRQANVDGARDAGLVAHRWESVADARAWLTGIGALAS